MSQKCNLLLPLPSPETSYADREEESMKLATRGHRDLNKHFIIIINLSRDTRCLADETDIYIVTVSKAESNGELHDRSFGDTSTGTQHD